MLVNNFEKTKVSPKLLSNQNKISFILYLFLRINITWIYRNIYMVSNSIYDLVVWSTIKFAKSEYLILNHCIRFITFQVR